MWQCYAAALFGLVALATAQTNPLEKYHPGNYPNPRTDVYKCGRYGKQSYICDPNNLLQLVEADQLDLQIERLMNDTKCPCSRFRCSDQNDRRGYRVGVAIMRKMADDQDEEEEDGDNQAKIESRLQKAKLFAYHLEQTWGLGQCQEDVIILFSQDDNVVYTMTGDVARLKLRSPLIGEISLKARAQFGPHTYEGLRQMISQFRAVFENDYKIAQHGAPRVAALQAAEDGASGISVTLSILLSCLLAAILN